MTTLTQIKARLEAHGLRPRHRFGQNFLIDARKVEMILASAGIAPGRKVLEVGPGTGVLSEKLLEAGAELVMVEIDAGLEPLLREIEAAHPGRARLVIADVLSGKHRVNPAVTAALGPGPYTLVANLPYNVASPLIANLVIDHPGMTDAVVMVQREVAHRLAAAPGGKDYGPLGILVQAGCQVETVTSLPPECFWPRPKVDSTVVRLRRRARPLSDDLPRLSALLQRLFQKRRKQIGAILGRSTALPEGIDPNARPEQLSVEQLAELARQVS